MWMTAISSMSLTTIITMKAIKEACMHACGSQRPASPLSPPSTFTTATTIITHHHHHRYRHDHHHNHHFWNL
jgi:hypothetical protein